MNKFEIGDKVRARGWGKGLWLRLFLPQKQNPDALCWVWFIKADARILIDGDKLKKEWK
jgi:hypothetical protein